MMPAVCSILPFERSVTVWPAAVTAAPSEIEFVPVRVRPPAVAVIGALVEMLLPVMVSAARLTGAAIVTAGPAPPPRPFRVSASEALLIWALIEIAVGAVRIMVGAKVFTPSTLT